MRRTLREREPQRPSTMVTTLQGQELITTAKERRAEPPKLISLLKGDLDWIVMKALEKDRSRRYETANGLAMDIQRHLFHEPVVARPPSRFYRFQKLVRRNKVAFAAAGAVALTLCAGLGTSTWMFFKEREARQAAVEAEQRAEHARATVQVARRQAEAREKITQAAVLIGKDRFGEADRLIAEMPLTPVTMEGAAVFRALAEWHALKTNWLKTSQRYTVLLQMNQLDGWDLATLDYLGCGVALAELKELDGYNHFRDGAIRRFSGTTSPVAAERVVKISLLKPASASVMSALRPLSEFAGKTFATAENKTYEDSFRTAWGAVSLALMEYRRGNFEKAGEWCARCLSCPDQNEVRSATAQTILAMIYFQEGKLTAAQSELASADRTISARFNTPLDLGSRDEGFWFDWQFAHILLREAKATVAGPQLSAKVNNDAQ
jgi:hypothetical protein